MMIFLHCCVRCLNFNVSRIMKLYLVAWMYFCQSLRGIKCSPLSTRVYLPIGLTGTINCPADAAPPTRLNLWSKNGETIDLTGDNDRVFTNEFGSLVIEHVDQSDEGLLHMFVLHAARRRLLLCQYSRSRQRSVKHSTYFNQIYLFCPPQCAQGNMWITSTSMQSNLQYDYIKLPCLISAIRNACSCYWDHNNNPIWSVN